ncbi:MAG TPA: carboxypeptidase regulatory-like domain-containing protein, partial [bacterium]|nr:carboxypeptidase regulatory-like domain-containing protein [bacterium]
MRRIILFALIMLLSAVPVAASVDIAAYATNISLQSSNPSRWINQIAEGEYGEIKIDLLNQQDEFAYDVQVGFYCDGAQIGDTKWVAVPGYGRHLIGSQYVWNTAGYGDSVKTVTVQVYCSSDGNPGNNSASRPFYVQEQSATGSVSGQVLNRYNQPVPGCRVVAYSNDNNDHNATTDIDGNYSITYLAPGTYSLAIDSSPYLRAWQQGVIVAGNQTTPGIDFMLNADTTKSGTIRVTVRDQYGVAVNLADSFGGWAYNGVALTLETVDHTSNEEIWLMLGYVQPADGICVFDRIPAGLTVNVGLWEPRFKRAGEVWLTNYSSDRANNLLVNAGSMIVLDDFVTYPAGTISGLVTDAVTGAPLTGLEMYATPMIGTQPDNPMSSSATTDTRGYYRFEHLRPGTYRVQYESKEAPGYMEQAQYGIVVEVGGDNATCNFMLQPGAEVYGTLTNISRLIELTGFYPGPNRGLGICATGILTAAEQAAMFSQLGDYALDEYIVKAFAQKLNLQTGEYSFDYSFPASGSYHLSPAMWWEEENGCMTISVFGRAVQASPGTGNETGPVNITLSTSLGRVTGNVTPSTIDPRQVTIWAMPSDRSVPMAGYANPGRNTADGSLTYTLPFLPVGTYDIFATYPGYDSVVFSRVPVAQGATRMLPVVFISDTVVPVGPTPAPGNPVSLALETDGLEINWVAPADRDLAGYEIYRDTGAALPDSYVRIGYAPAGMLTYVDDRATETNVTYKYRIRSVDLAGNRTALGATGLWTFTLANASLALLSPPPVVTGTDTQLTFSWSNVGMDTYGFELSTASGEDLYETSVAATSISLSTSLLTARSSYQWQVEGYNNAGTSGLKSAQVGFYYNPAYTNTIWGNIGGRILNTTTPVEVRLYRVNDVGGGASCVKTLQTDTGVYSFTQLPAGTYMVRAGYRFDTDALRGTVLSDPIVANGVQSVPLTLDAINLGRIRGRVTTADGSPIPSTWVTANIYRENLGAYGTWLSMSETQTNANGEFTLEKLQRNVAYALTANTYEGGSSRYANCWLNDIVATWALPPYIGIVLEEGVAVSGLVTDSATGAPLGNCSLEFNSDQYDNSVTTNPYGVYYLNLPPGRYRVTVNAAEFDGDVMYGKYRLEDQRVSDGNSVINLRVPRGGSVSGTIDTTTAGFTGAVMAVAFPAGTKLSAENLFNDQLDPAGEGAVAAGGAYTIANLTTGSYDIYPIAYAESPRRDAGEETMAIVALMNPLTSVAVSAGATVTGKNFVLPANGRTITGQLQCGGDSIALAGDDMAAVVFTRADSTFQAVASMESLLAATPRAFRFVGVPDGTYNLIGYADGYQSLLYQVTVTADSAACNLNFATDNTAPAAPVWQATPLVPAFSDSHAVELQWRKDADAERYHIRRRQTGDTMTLTEYARPVITGDTAVYADYLTDTGAYTYALVAVDLAGNTSAGAPAAIALLDKAFTTTDTRIQPQTAAQGVLYTYTPTFTWNAVATATAYNLYIATDKGLQTIFAGCTGTSKAYPSDTSAPKLYPGRIYYWAIEAVSGAGARSRTGWRSFMISSGMTAPKIAHARIYSAVPGMDVPLTANVQAPGGVSSVTLQYGDNSGFVTVAMTADTYQSGLYRATIPGSYIDNLRGFYYRISAVSAGGQAQVPAGNPLAWSLSEAYFVPITKIMTVDGYACVRGTSIAIPDAQIWIRSSSGPVPVQVLTDDDGYFSVDLTFGDTYQLAAQKHGYAPIMPLLMNDTLMAYAPSYGAQVVLREGQSLPAPGSLTCYLDESETLSTGRGYAAGMVFDEFGNPIAGAMVLADRPDLPGQYNPDYALAVTDATGGYLLPNIFPTDSFSVLGVLTNNGQTIMRGMIGDMGEPDTFVVTATQCLQLPPMLMSARFADDQYPRITGVSDSGFYGVTVTFSEPLAPSAAEQSHYTLTMAGVPQQLARVVYAAGASQSSVRIEPQQAINSMAAYRLTVRGLQDWAGNSMPDTYVDFTFGGNDSVNPQVTGAAAYRGGSGGGEVVVYFSEPIRYESVDPNRFAIAGLTVHGAHYRGSSMQVGLEVSPMVDGQQYTVSCTTALDLAGMRSLDLGQECQGLLSDAT